MTACPILRVSAALTGIAALHRATGDAWRAGDDVT
jgi:hypothetical protein